MPYLFKLIKNEKIVCAITFLSFVISFQSCNEYEITKEERLNVKLETMENTIRDGILNIDSFFDPYNEANMNFIINLSNSKNSNDSDFSESVESMILEHNQEVLKSGVVITNKDDSEISLSITQELIFKSYVKALRINPLISKIKVAEYYINELQKIYYIPVSSRNYCIYAISLHKNLMNYVNINDKLENKSANSSLNRWWTPCSGRDCFDCCMFRKTQEMDDWNWIDWAWFLASSAANVAIMASSCGWDCIT